MVLLSCVRAVTWGEGAKLFCTASDAFHPKDECALISIFDFPSEDVLAGMTVLFILFYLDITFIC